MVLRFITSLFTTTVRETDARRGHQTIWMRFAKALVWAVVPGAISATVAAQPVPGLSLTWPVPTLARSAISQGFSQYGSGSATKFHAALDIAGPLDTTVVAAAGGTARVVLLSSAEWSGKTKCLGNVVIINHGSVSTLYAHLNSVSISNGAVVSAGQAIGKLGRSVGLTASGGNCVTGQSGSNGPVGFEHLHFELKLYPVLGSENDLGPPNIWGYTPAVGTTSPTLADEPTQFYFRNPVLNLHAGIGAQVRNMTVTSLGGGVNLRHGPGTDYSGLGTLSAAGDSYISVNVHEAGTTNCSLGWVQVRQRDGRFFPDTRGGTNPAAWMCRGNGGEVWLQDDVVLHELGVARSGSGSGTVSSSPAGISCGSDCTESVPAGTSITLTAVPSAGSSFSGWSGGGCSGTGTCTLAVNAATTVTATFSASPVMHALSIVRSGAGSGSVGSSPSGISCGSACNASFAAGTQVTLAAAAGAGSVFTGWSGGGCSGTGTCVVSMNSALSVTAAFAPAPQRNLLIATGGSGAGTVTASPGGACTTPCTGGRLFTLDQDATVTLSAMPAAGSVFLGWSGAYGSAYLCSGTGGCVFSLGVDSGATAIFGVATPSLQILRSGSGQGTVISSPAGIDCGTACSAALASGTPVTLTAQPGSGSAFDGWSGVSCDGGNSGSTCTFALTTDRTVTARFESSQNAPRDFNDDARSDLLWQNSTDGSVQGWLMNGLAADKVAGLLPAGSYTVTHVADLDGDGKADTLVRSSDGTTIGWLHDGLAVVGQATFFAAGSGWSIKHTADLNGDGKADLIVEHSNGTVVGWLMNGLTVVGTSTFVPAGAGWSVLRVGDLDGDGKADLIWQHTNGTVQAWLMDGLSATQTATFVGVGTGWSVKLVADFNGDSKADLVWQNSDGAVQAWLMNGLGITQIASFVPAGTSWSPVLAGDIDGDGKADLFWEHTGGRSQTWLMDGFSVLGIASFVNAGNWQVSHLLDLNGDGRRDVLWRHSDGTVQAWLLNGLVIQDVASLARAGKWEVIPAQR